jgi:hypothetical protein
MEQIMQKAEAQHQHAPNPSVACQGNKGMAIESPRGERIAQLRTLLENGPQSREQRVKASPRMAAQRRMTDMIQHSPRLAAQRKEAPATPNNTGLPDHLKNGIESLSGISMERVKVHYNSARPAQLNALAYAQGTDIHLAPGQEKHLPHEAWHVVQQAQGRVQPTMQMKDGAPVNDDAGLEHEADVMGARASLVVPGTRPHASSDQMDSPPGTTSGAGMAVQRIVRLAGAQVPPPFHDELVERVRARFQGAHVDFLEAHELTLRGWVNDHDHVIAAPSIDVLAFNLFAHANDHGSWAHGMTFTRISDTDMQAAKAMRSRDRFARVMEPAKTSTPSRVPGLAKLDDKELLRIQEAGEEEEEQNWLRLQEGPDAPVEIVKRKGISGEDEAHITAAGDKDNPSYVVTLNNHHLGHRYVGSGRQKGTGNPRTYGSKKKREGYEYKGSGLVDGHAIQVQDDQQILGPFQDDAEDWVTTIKKTDGSTVTYPDKPYLPKDASDSRMIETHPHNFYWENQGQGQRMRQKAIEAPAMKSGASFLHYNAFAGETFHPNDGRARDHTYDLASRVHYLHTDTAGTRKHYSVDNRAVADYSNPGGYDATTRQYPDIPSGIPKKGENKNLGGLSAYEHLKLAEMPDATSFPYSTVLHPEAPDFSFKPKHRKKVTGYESPPPSPYWAPQELEEDERVATGDLSRKRHFHDIDDTLVVGADYDKAKDQTTLKRKKRKIGEVANWPEGGSEFEQLAASRLTKKPTPAAVDEPGTEFVSSEGSEVAMDPAILNGMLALLEAIEGHQHGIDHLAHTLHQLQTSLDDQHVGEHGALQALIDQLGQIDRYNPGQAGVVDVIDAQAVGWFRANANLLYRAIAGRRQGEPGDDPLGVSGERLDSLRQYFYECAQMAVHNVLALSNENDDEFDEHLLDRHGNFGQNLDEDDIREMLDAAKRSDLPVIGNLGDLQGLLFRFDILGDAAADAFHIGEIEQTGHDFIRAFGLGLMDVLNLVVNTQAATKMRGTHWIAVQLRRQADGQIAIRYLDSYDAPNDYRQLFDGLRAFFGAVRPNVLLPFGARPILGDSHNPDGSQPMFDDSL